MDRNTKYNKAFSAFFVIILSILAILLVRPELHTDLFSNVDDDLVLPTLNENTYADIFNQSCNYNKNEAEIVINNSSFKNRAELRLLDNTYIQFSYTSFKCFSKIKYANEIDGVLYYYLQPIPKITILFLILFIVFIISYLNNKFTFKIAEQKEYVFNLSKLKKLLVGFSLIIFCITSFMFFYNKLPQINSSFTALNSKYLTISKPTQIYTDQLTIPIFDQSCKYSPRTAIEALKSNGFNQNKIELKPYFEKGFFNPVAINLSNFKCWDRVVGSSYSQGTVLDEDAPIILYYNPYPRLQLWLLSFTILFLTFKLNTTLYVKNSKYDVPIYVPGILINNFHLFLLSITVLQFLNFLQYMDGYVTPFKNLTYMIFIFLGFYIIQKLVLDHDNNLFVIAVMLIFISYSIILFQNQSINNLFTDVDVFQSQLPISNLQYEQVNNYGKFFTWNSHLGAGTQLTGQYATDSLLRQLIFSVSPNFNFATNFYFFSHISIGMYVLILFFKELEFSNFSSIIGAFIFFTSNQIITWSTFLHYPAFMLSFSLLVYGLLISKKKPLISISLIILSFYISSTGSHLQNLFFLYFYTFLFLAISYFIKDLKNKISYGQVWLALFFSILISAFYVLPFFDLLNNIGDRTSEDITNYLSVNNLGNFFDNKLLSDSNQVIYKSNINTQLFISTVAVFLLLFLKTNRKTIERFGIYSFIIIFILSTDNPFQNFIVENIPGLNLVSNWQRVSPFLIFTITILIISKLEAYLKKNTNNYVYLIILISVFLSAFTRINAFYNPQIKELQSTELYIQMQDIKKINLNPSISTFNSRIFSMCNDDYAKTIVPDISLIMDSQFYWVGLYESFPNRFFSSKFKTISGTNPGDFGGRYYTHLNGDRFSVENLDNLNIEYLILNSGDCEFDKSNFTLVDKFDNHEVYRKNSYKPIIFFETENKKIIVPDKIERINPELIKVEIYDLESNGQLNFNEIYSEYWGALVNSETVQVMNKDGFMSVEVKKGKNVVFFEFNNKRLDLNMKLLSEFITNDR